MAKQLELGMNVWVPYLGVNQPNVGKHIGWRNIQTDEIRYQDENPGANDEQAADSPSDPSDSGSVYQWSLKKFGSAEVAKNFTEWFGDSKITEKYGHADYENEAGPLEVYHGSPSGVIEEFDFSLLGGNTGAATTGLGVFFTNDPEVAAGFSGKPKDDLSRVTSVYLRMENPLVFENEDPYSDAFYDLKNEIESHDSNYGWNRDPKVTSEAAKSYVESLRFRGYDGIIIKNTSIDAVQGGHTMFIVFSKEQIKSSEHNSGSFSLKSGSTRMSAWVKYTGPRGGEGWRNVATNEIRYQSEMPGTATSTSAEDVASSKAQSANGAVLEWAKEQFQDEQVAKNFTEWFGDSKVVSADGTPLVVYHGSDNKFDVFENRIGKVTILFSVFDVERAGFFFSPVSGVAESFGRNVRPFYLAVKSPADFTKTEYHPGLARNYSEPEIRLMQELGYPESFFKRDAWEWFDKNPDDEYPGGKHLVDDLKSLGYDGAIIEGSVSSELVDSLRLDEYPKEWIAFDPGQIKLADGNSGSFDANNPSVSMSTWVKYKGPRGGEGWRNTATDEVRYQAEMPKSKEKATPDSIGTRDVVPEWWNQPSENVYAKGMTNGEVTEDWLKRHRLSPDENGFYTLFHGSPISNLTDLRAGSHLTFSEESAKHYASRDRDISDDDVTVYEVKFKPWEIRGHQWATTLVDIPVTSSAELRSQSAPNSKVQSWAEKQFKDKTAAKNFTEWFGDSKVVDADGNPLVVYHGTSESFDQFDTSISLTDGRDRAAFFSDTPEVAATYAEHQVLSEKQRISETGRALADLEREYDRLLGELPPERENAFINYTNQAVDSGQITREEYQNLHALWDRHQELDSYTLDEMQDYEAQKKPQMKAVYLSLKNPKIIDANGMGSSYIVPNALQDIDRKKHDGIIFRNIVDTGDGTDTKSTVFAVFNPTGIKSATGNSGAFDSGNPAITMSTWVKYSGPRGGQGWRNVVTDEVRYQSEMPDGSEPVPAKLTGFAREVADAIEMSGIAADHIRLLYDDAVAEYVGNDFADLSEDRGLTKAEVEAIRDHFRQRSVAAAKKAGVQFPFTAYRGEAADDTKPVIAMTRDHKTAAIHASKSKRRVLRQQEITEADVLFWAEAFPGTYSEDEWLVFRKQPAPVEIGSPVAVKKIESWAERQFKDRQAAKNFIAWFGKSKAVDEYGQPKVYYHGTMRPGFNEFKTDQPSDGVNRRHTIAFAPDPEFASRYASDVGGGVYPVFLKIENPADYRNEEHCKLLAKYRSDNFREFLLTQANRVAWKVETEEALERRVELEYQKDLEAVRSGYWAAGWEDKEFLEKYGFDGAYVQENWSQHEKPEPNLVVLHNSQIKSATGNSGDFREPGNITMSTWVPYLGPRGGRGWKNTATDEVRYQKEQPEDLAGDSAASSSTPIESLPLDKSFANRVKDQRERRPNVSESWKWYLDYENEPSEENFQSLQNAVIKKLTSSPSLARIRQNNPEKASEYAASMSAAIKNVPTAKALILISENARDIRYLATTGDVSVERRKLELRGVSLSEAEKERELQRAKSKANTVGFFMFIPRFDEENTGVLHVNGGGGSGPYSQFSKTQSVYSHELGHVVDGHYAYSERIGWIWAWEKEIKSTANLSEYATTDATEGFAEFFRLVLENPSTAKTMFPKCWSSFRDWGLV